MIFPRFAIVVFFGLFSAFSLAASGQLKIVENSKSDYRIVIPDKGKNPLLEYFWEEAARCLKNCIFESTGASLPIQEESKGVKTQPGIYVGGTVKASADGIDTEKFAEWEYVIKSSGKDIILRGKDIIGELAEKKKSKGYYSYELGSVKAVTSFIELYCGTRFVMPGPNGVSIRKKALIEVPENLNIKKKPFFKYCIGRLSGDMYYDIANNLYSTVRYGSYGGHSHPVAVPQDKYFKDHPEYFALIKGKRYTHETRYQYCLSNTEVQELIYKELLRKLDEGYDYVQLAQTDGFKPCECENYKKLYNTDDFGEKVWIMHKNMAERLLKDRPGKKIMLLQYNPCYNPPRTFKEFPENVIVELCNYTPENIAKWKNIKVPGGFTVYVYNWGYYKTEGFTPSNTPEFCKEQIDLFRKSNIWGIYHCGFGELRGLEGPVYYTYGKLLEDPAKDPLKLAGEFCDFAYPASAKPMKEFFSLLHERLKLKSGSDQNTDWGNRNLLEGKVPDMKENVKVLFVRYPSEVAAKMQAYLDEALNTAKDKKELARINLVKMEFEYLKKTALVAELYDKYRKEPAKDIFNALITAIETRNNFIESLPTMNKGKNVASYEGFSLFASAEPAILKSGGRLRCELKTPYDWDTAWFRKMNIAPGAREIKALYSEVPLKLDGIADEAVWQKAEAQNFVELYMNKEVEVPDLSVQTAYDKEAFYVLFKTKKYLPPNWEKTLSSSFSVFLGPTKTLEETYMFPCGDSRTSAGTWKRFQTENPEAPNEFKGIAVDKKVDVAWKLDEAGGGITAEYRIPFSIFPTVPGKGDVWYGNFIRRVSGAKGHIDFIWEPNINWKTWRNRYDVMGKIIFE